MSGNNGQPSAVENTRSSSDGVRPIRVLFESWDSLYFLNIDVVEGDNDIVRRPLAVLGVRLGRV